MAIFLALAQTIVSIFFYFLAYLGMVLACLEVRRFRKEGSISKGDPWKFVALFLAYAVLFGALGTAVLLARA